MIIKKVLLVSVLLITVGTYFQLEASALQHEPTGAKHQLTNANLGEGLHPSLILLASGIAGLSLLRIRNRP